MLDLQELSPEEMSRVTRQVARECEERLRRIAEASDPFDAALQGLLTAMANDLGGEHRALVEEGASLSAEPSGRLSTEDARRIVRASLPSLVKGFGEGKLDRDFALFYAESLEEEASRFYRKLAEHAREAKAFNLYAALSDRERTRLQYLREVVLAG